MNHKGNEFSQTEVSFLPTLESVKEVVSKKHKSI